MKKILLMTGALMALSCGTANAAVYFNFQPIIEPVPPVYYAPAPVVVAPPPVVVVQPRVYGYVERHHHYDWRYWQTHQRPVVIERR
jgi:hypothetical protein